MTNTDSATTSINNNDLMNAESTSNVEDVSPVSKNSTPTIRNLRATTPPPAQPSPPTQHAVRPSASTQQATTTTNLRTTTPSTQETLQVVGTGATLPEYWRGSHHVHHTNQSMLQQQALDQRAAPGSNPPDTPSLTSTARKRKEELNALGTEEVETVVFKRIKEEVTSLPLALQPMAIEWAEELLTPKDFIQTKKTSLQNQCQSNTPRNSALLTFKLRALENARDALNTERASLCKIADETKKQVSNLFSKFIAQVPDWEAMAAKSILAEKLLKTQMKFTRSLISSMIIADDHASTKIKEANEQSFNISKLMIEIQLLENSTSIVDCLELSKFETIRI